MSIDVLIDEKFIRERLTCVGGVQAGVVVATVTKLSHTFRLQSPATHSEDQLDSNTRKLSHFITSGINGPVRLGNFI